MGFCEANNTAFRFTNPKGSLRGFAVLIIVAAILLGTPAVNMPIEKVLILFYSSETNINNFKSLKILFDAYLAGFGAYEFQPFDDRAIFEEHLKNKDNCVLLLSSWHFNLISKRHGLSPALLGLRNGNKFHQRILVAPGTTANRDILKQEPIASSSSLGHTRSVLAGMLHDQEKADSARILTVPKDLDALMSVGFGMSGAALTNRNAFEELYKVNPTLFNRLKVMAEGPESYLLILAVPEIFKGNTAQTVSVIKQMPMDSKGKEKIRMLGLDGWDEPDSFDKRRLEAK